MKVTIRYFAALREARGLSLETVDIEPMSVSDLYQSLSLGLDASLVRFAIRNDFVAPETMLQDGDEVTFIPPVAGG